MGGNMNSESGKDLDNHVAIHIQCWEPEGKPKGVVCLIHGLGDHVGRFEHVGRAFNNAGYFLSGFDLRGHGKTCGPRGHIPSLKTIMQDIHQFMELQKKNHPDLPAFLYGHSFGGLLTLAYAIQYGNELSGVIVTGAGLRSPLLEHKMKVILAKLFGLLLPEITISTGLDSAMISRDRDAVQRYMNDPLVHNRTSLGLVRTGLNAITICFARAKELKPPLLIMHGTADEITYPGGSKEFAMLVSEANKDVTLKLWDGLYHELHNEPEQAEVFKVMTGWLDRHL
jgi:alpha-beta hydrolase superfamily lysophospholipase